jgi:hypothetical protein
MIILSAEPQSLSSSLPDFVPNTHPDEPSIPPDDIPMPEIAGPSRNLRRSATPSTSRRPPKSFSVEIPQEPVDAPEEVLPRRVRISPILLNSSLSLIDGVYRR